MKKITNTLDLVLVGGCFTTCLALFVGLNVIPH